MQLTTVEATATATMTMEAAPEASQQPAAAPEEEKKMGLLEKARWVLSAYGWQYNGWQ